MAKADENLVSDDSIGKVAEEGVLEHEVHAISAMDKHVVLFQRGMLLKRGRLRRSRCIIVYL